MTDQLQTLYDLLHIRRHRSADRCTPPIAHPVRDWVWICTGCVLLLLVCMSFAFFLFITVKDVDAETPSASKTPALGPSAQDLDAVLLQYKALADEHAALLTAPPSVVDPAKPR